MKQHCHDIGFILPKMDKTVLLKIEDMNEFLEIYRRIGYLRNKGVKMKEIADRIDMTPSVLSSLYTTVFPALFRGGEKKFPGRCFGLCAVAGE